MQANIREDVHQDDSSFVDNRQSLGQHSVQLVSTVLQCLWESVSFKDYLRYLIRQTSCTKSHEIRQLLTRSADFPWSAVFLIFECWLFIAVIGHPCCIFSICHRPRELHQESEVVHPSDLLSFLLLVLVSILELLSHFSFVTSRVRTVGVLFWFPLGSSFAALWFGVLAIKVEVVIFVEVPLHDCSGSE